MFDFLLTFVPFVRANWFFIILFIFAFSVDFTLRRYRARVKAQVYAKHEQELQVNINEGQNKKRNAEFYIEYYKKVQILDTIRIAFIVFVIVVFLAEKTWSAFDLLAVWVWVIILIFKEVILSFAAFFYVISRYKIGDIMRFGSINSMECLGEIIAIHTLYVSMIAKDQSGNHTWRVIYVPNYKFFTEINQRLDLSSQWYRRIDLEIIYNSNRFEVSFQEFMNKLERFLDDHLSIRTSKLAENFKSYFGLKYKISLNYEGENIRVSLSFIQPASNTTSSKKNIIYFVESLRHKHTPHHTEHEKDDETWEKRKKQKAKDTEISS